MNEILEVYTEDLQEKKKAFPKFYGKPSPVIKKKEWEKMNGQVATLTLKGAKTYKEFKSMPNDLQKQYLELCIANGGTAQDIAEMMGCAYATAWNACKELGVRLIRGKVPAEKHAAWKAFLGQEALSPPELPLADRAPVDTDLLRDHGRLEAENRFLRQELESLRLQNTQLSALAKNLKDTLDTAFIRAVV